MTTPTNQDTASVMTLEETMDNIARLLSEQQYSFHPEERGALQSSLHHLEAGKFDGLLLDFLERNTTPDERHDVMHLPGLPWAGSVRQAIHAEICAEWPLPLSHPEQEGQQG